MPKIVNGGTLCCVPNCKGRGGHRFPQDEVTRLLWTNAIRSAGKSQSWNGPKKSTTVCRLHFREEDYFTTTKLGELLM